MEFQGVSFNQSQSDRIAAQTAVIDSLISQRKAQQDSYNFYVGQVAQDIDNKNNTAWAYDANKRDTAERNVSSLSIEITTATKQYNDVLESIQNEIKLSIQASQANTDQATQLAQNNLTLTQNNPALLSEKLKAQSEIDKAKIDNKHKTIVFSIVSITVLVIGFFVIKKLL